LRRYVAIPLDGGRLDAGFAVKDRWTGRLILEGPFSQDEASRLADAKELLPVEPIGRSEGQVPAP
jgi:hypothetical protein